MQYIQRNVALNEFRTGMKMSTNVPFFPLYRGDFQALLRLLSTSPEESLLVHYAKVRMRSIFLLGVMTRRTGLRFTILITSDRFSA